MGPATRPPAPQLLAPKSLEPKRRPLIQCPSRHLSYPWIPRASPRLPPRPAHPRPLSQPFLPPWKRHEPRRRRLAAIRHPSPAPLKQAPPRRLPHRKPPHPPRPSTGRPPRDPSPAQIPGPLSDPTTGKTTVRTLVLRRVLGNRRRVPRLMQGQAIVLTAVPNTPAWACRRRRPSQRHRLSGRLHRRVRRRPTTVPPRVLPRRRFRFQAPDPRQCPIPPQDSAPTKDPGA